MGLHARIQAGVFWLAIAGVLVSALALGANRPISWLALSSGALGLLAVQMILDLGDRAAGRLWWRVAPIAVLYLGVVAWAAVQTLPSPIEGWAHPAWNEAGVRAGIPALNTVSADPAATWHGVLRYLAYAAIFWIAARGASDLDRARRLVDVIALFSVALAVYGLAAWAFETNPIAGDESYPGMVKASFVNRNAYAFHAGLGAMACLVALALRLPKSFGDRAMRLGATRDLVEMLTGEGRWYLIGFVVILAALFLTGSRAGAAVSLVGIAIVLMQTFGRGGGMMRWLAILVLALPVAGLMMGAQGLNKRLAESDPLEDHRMVVYEQAWQGITERPVMGHGLGAFHDAFRQYVPARFTGNEWDLAHNSYLENAFEMGVPAMAALTLALALIGFVIWAGLSERRRMRPLMVYGLAVFVAGGLHALVDFSLQMPANASLFAVILGVTWALARRDAAEAIVSRRRRSKFKFAHGRSTPNPN